MKLLNINYETRKNVYCSIIVLILIWLSSVLQYTVHCTAVSVNCLVIIIILIVTVK